MALTYFSGSSQIQGEIFELKHVASGWVAGDDKPIGGLNWAAMCAKLPMQDSSAVKLNYELEDQVTDPGIIDATRPGNGEFPSGQPGRGQTRDITLEDRGKLVYVDANKDAALLKNMSADQLGGRRAAYRTRSVMMRLLSALLNPAATPWNLADQAESALWSLAATNIMGDVIAGLEAYEAAQDLRVPPINAVAMGANVYRDHLTNTTLTTQYGGNTGFGPLPHEAILQAYKNVGIDHMFVYPHTLFGGVVTFFSFSGAESDPSDDATPSSVVFAHEGPVDEFASIVGETVPKTAGRVRSYVAPVVGGFGLKPEFGYRFGNVLA